MDINPGVIDYTGEDKYGDSQEKRMCPRILMSDLTTTNHYNNLQK